MMFLRPIVAFWCAVGILTAFAGTFIFLPSNDVSLNVISLFAFLLVIGIVVDDAIIVGENIHSENEKGREGADAAIMGAYLVSKPVFFAVITSMIAFAPWLFLTGWQVQFVQNISIIYCKEYHRYICLVVCHCYHWLMCKSYQFFDPSFYRCNLFFGPIF